MITRRRSSTPRCSANREPGVLLRNSADTEGNTLADGWTHAGTSRHEWQYTFRPWEIATFRVT